MHDNRTNHTFQLGTEDTSYLQHWQRAFLQHSIEVRRNLQSAGLAESPSDDFTESVDRWRKCPNCGYEIALVKIGNWPATWMDVFPPYEGSVYRGVDLTANPHHCEVW